MAKPLYHSIEFTEAELQDIYDVIEKKYIPQLHSDPYALSSTRLDRILARIRKKKKEIGKA